jgi:hypothetical protein
VVSAPGMLFIFLSEFWISEPEVGRLDALLGRLGLTLSEIDFHYQKPVFSN